MIAYLKASPGKYSYGSAGNGTTTHLTVELFKTRAGVDVLHVPYRGSAPAIQELLAGRFDFTIETLSAVKPFIASGQLIAIGVTSALRSPLMPTVPTVAELGLPDVIGATWNMILAPAGTPQPVVDRLNQALRTALADPNVVARLTELAIEPIADTTPASARAFLVDEIARWAPVVRASGATVD
ncbi:MAG: tripartite tricarboxylate transporter substrate-binding protein [Pseudomonadota bacterium]